MRTNYQLCCLERPIFAKFLVIITMLLSLTLYAETNVKDFGAVGDGTTDDTTAIQDALDTAGYLWFPSGTYKITSTLTIDRSISLRGENAIIAPTGAFCTFQLGNSSYLTNLSAGYHTIKMTDLRINQATGGTGIVNQGIRTIKLNDITIIGGVTALETEGAWSRSSAIDCKFQNQTGNAVELKQRNNLFFFRQCCFLGADMNGVKISTVNAELKNITFLQCDFEGNSGALNVMGNVAGINLNSSWFENNSVFNICIDNNTGNKYAITIQGCQITGTGVDLILGNNNNGNLIDGCTISSNEFANSKLIVATGTGVVLNTAVLGNHFNDASNLLLPPAKAITSKNLGAYMPMPLYTDNEYIPWGSGDTKGIVGEIRYDDYYFYMRTDLGWGCAPLSSF